MYVTLTQHDLPLRPMPHVLYCNCGTLILHILCRQDHESKKSQNDRSGAHAASRGQATCTAFTDVERDKKTPKAAGAITSNGGMPSDYQVMFCYCTVQSAVFEGNNLYALLGVGVSAQTLQG